MKARISKLVGTLFITLAVFNLMFRVLGGPELSLLPWPVSMIVIAIGVLLLRMGGSIEGWSAGSREETRTRFDPTEHGSASGFGPRGQAGHLPPLSFSGETSDWGGRRIVLDTPLRMVAFLAAFAAFLCGVMAVLEWGFQSRHWSPPIVAMISLTVSSLSLALCSLVFVRKRARNGRTHA